MKNLIKNQTFLTLTSADIFETMGTSLFNIILLTYAKEFTHANAMVSLVSVATVMPGILGVLTGRIADRTHNKRIWLASTKFIQAGLYFLLAQLINQRQVVLLIIIILINIFSDIIGMYSGSLRMPIIQTKISNDLQEQAVGINQRISTIMQTVGQAIGVSLLALTNNYQLAGYINAFTFLIAGIILSTGYNSLKIQTPRQQTPSWHKLISQMKKALETSSDTNAWALLSSIFFMNAVGASLDAIINLYLIDQGNKLPLSFNVSVLTINTILVGGTILGSILHSGWFQKWSFRSVMSLCVFVLEIFYINLINWESFIIVLISMAIGGFCMGQINPKLTASLLKNADSEIVGSLTGLMNTISIISMPLGAIVLVLIYNIINPETAYIISMILLLLSLLCLFLPQKKQLSRKLRASK
ncbi:MFS transporter [Companilactobacillus alimentarius]